MKTFVITGGNSGLGFETARRIAATGARVILACRNKEKGESAAEEIRKEEGNPNIESRILDLASLQSVRDFADSLNGIVIDGLDNNAGISGQHMGMTSDGMDIVFQSNYLGHFLLTRLLLPHMAEDGRILNISSDMHNPPYVQLEWKGVDAMVHPAEDMMKLRYFYSKLCNLYFTYELDRKFRSEGRNLTVNALNPGFMGDTNLAGGNMSPERIEHVRKTMPDRYGELPVSASAAADILVKEEYGRISGKYFDRSTKTADSSELSYNTQNARELWNASMRLTSVH